MFALVVEASHLLAMFQSLIVRAMELLAGYSLKDARFRPYQRKGNDEAPSVVQ